MKKRRIVITGVGCVSPYGTGLTALMTGISNYRCSLKLDNYLDREYVVGKVPDFNEKDIPREYSRTMPRMGKYAYTATHEALVKQTLIQVLLTFLLSQQLLQVDMVVLS